MREATLPFKWRECDDWMSALVRKAESPWETLKLSWGPGFWFSHHLFGSIRVVGIFSNREPLQKEPHR